MTQGPADAVYPVFLDVRGICLTESSGSSKLNCHNTSAIISTVQILRNTLHDAGHELELFANRDRLSWRCSSPQHTPRTVQSQHGWLYALVWQNIGRAMKWMSFSLISSVLRTQIKAALDFYQRRNVSMYYCHARSRCCSSSETFNAAISMRQSRRCDVSKENGWREWMKLEMVMETMRSLRSRCRCWWRKREE